MESIFQNSSGFVVPAVLLLAASPFISEMPTQADENSSVRVEQMKTTLKGKGKMRGFKTDTSNSVETRTFFAPSEELASLRAMGDLVDGEYTEVKQMSILSEDQRHRGAGELGIPVGSDAIAVSYRVDLASRLKGEVLFEKGSSRIVEAGTFEYLRDLALALKDPTLSNYKFVIEGHASAEGNSIRNKKLSQKRAWAIYETLISRYGVDPSQIYALGYGEDEARYPSDSPESLLAKDRRVMVYKLISMQSKPGTHKAGGSGSSSTENETTQAVGGKKMSL